MAPQLTIIIYGGHSSTAHNNNILWHFTTDMVCIDIYICEKVLLICAQTSVTKAHIRQQGLFQDFFLLGGGCPEHAVSTPARFAWLLESVRGGGG